MENSDHSDIKRIEREIRDAEQVKNTVAANLGLNVLTDPDLVKTLGDRYTAARLHIEMLKSDLEKAKAANIQMPIFIQVRPALEHLIVHWQAVPRKARRELFMQFGKYITLSRLARSTMRVIIEWCDGTQSLCDVQGGGYRWPREDTQKLRDMIEQNVDQMEILRAFPLYTWYELMQRYADLFNNRRWPKDTYLGKKPYPVRYRWSDTEEFKTEQPNLCSPGSSTSIHSTFQPRRTHSF